MLAARRERWQCPAFPGHQEIVAVRADERGPLPPLAVALLAEERLVRRGPLLHGDALDLAAIHEVEALGAGEPRARLAERRDELGHELGAPQRDRRCQAH